HTRCYRDWSSDVCSSDLSQTVFPALSWVKQQREGGQAFHGVLNRAVIGHETMGNVRALVHGTEQIVPVIGQARGMPQEVANRDLPAGGNRVRLARGRFDQDLRILELGQVF